MGVTFYGNMFFIVDSFVNILRLLNAMMQVIEGLFPSVGYDLLAFVGPMRQ